MTAPDRDPVTLAREVLDAHAAWGKTIAGSDECARAAWRSDEGVLIYVSRERIDPDTWKKGNR